MSEHASPLRLPAARASSWARLGAHVPIAATLAALGGLVLVPLGYLVWRTFFPDGTLTLDVVREA